MWRSLVLLALVLQMSHTVDRNNFKTCEQSSFCRRCRKVAPDNSQYELVSGSLSTYSDSITADIVNKENNHLFVLKLQALKDNTFHVLINEKTPLLPRYRSEDVLKGPTTPDTIKVSEDGQDLVIESGINRAIIKASPLKIDFYNGKLLVVSANARGLMRFEHLRTKPQPPQNNPDEGGETNELKTSVDEEEPGSWEEDFKSHHDSKPRGPEAVALDFTFPQAQILFGIPEHADSFALKSTADTDPYRLYNLDVFEYELDNGMALYGSIPVIYGHGGDATVGVFWDNPSETWVDIVSPNTEKNVLSSIVNIVSGSRQNDPPAAHFMSESGVMDVYILMGPSPLATFKQYTDLTGTAPLPQMFALAYHQCRWNYNDEQDVAAVSQKFDDYDMPMDTMWLDIEYTDGKKYFTWDSHKFPHSTEMIQNLTALGRHLTVIIDPHIKRDSNYFFHNDCTKNGYYVKNKDGNDYDGWCWPGAASYPDVFNPEVRKYFADQYLLENFHGTTEDVMIWNDMNEPSVFNGPEVTMLKDNKHFGGWEHRHVHNLYAHMHLRSTFDGLMRRSAGKQRPFILTRGHYSGSQRYAALWTGDNTAEWGHLVASIKMCLTEAVAGFSFCGADVGGFFGNVEAELFERWYQAGAFQPFFRSHAHIDTKRREPWLFPTATRLVIREALRKRYSYLPLWYTLFYEHERIGYPVMRPLLAHYPSDKDAFAIDNQYLLGDALMVRPVLQQGVNKVDVYFPFKSDKVGDFWYDVDDFRKIDRPGYQTINVDAYKIPVYQRGGSIVPKKERIRRSSPLMKHDPYTLVVCLDKAGYARGTLYIDDEKSYEYRNGKYLYVEMEFKNNVLTSKLIDPNNTYDTRKGSFVERVVIAGLDNLPNNAILKSGDMQQQTKPLKEGNIVIVRKPDFDFFVSWSIELQY